MTMMPEKLPPFSPRGSVSCRMCGSDHISALYMATGRCLHSDSGHQVIECADAAANPRMHRECEECGNVWDERTLADSPEVRERLANASRSPLQAPHRPPAPKP